MAVHKLGGLALKANKLLHLSQRTEQLYCLIHLRRKPDQVKEKSAIMYMSLCCMVVIFSMGIRGAPMVAVDGDEDTAVIEIHREKLCEPCEDYQVFFLTHGINEAEQDSIWRAVTQSSDGETCCLHKVLPILELWVAFSKHMSRGSYVEDKHQRGHALTLLHAVPMRPIPSTHDEDYIEIAAWDYRNYGTTFLLGLKGDALNDGIRIRHNGIYSITVSMAWIGAGDHPEDGFADIHQVKLTRTHPSIGEEILAKDRDECSHRAHMKREPCARVSLTATLDLRKKDKLRVYISHPSQLMGNPNSYIDIIQQR